VEAGQISPEAEWMPPEAEEAGWMPPDGDEEEKMLPEGKEIMPKRAV